MLKKAIVALNNLMYVCRSILRPFTGYGASHNKHLLALE